MNEDRLKELLEQGAGADAAEIKALLRRAVRRDLPTTIVMTLYDTADIGEMTLDAVTTVVDAACQKVYGLIEEVLADRSDSDGGL